MNHVRKHVLPMDKHHFCFDKELPPVLHINSGDEVTFFTEDANASYITKESDVISDWQKMYDECGGCNPVTGPVYVDGAKKGDYLAIEILSIKPGEERGGGYSSAYPGFGALSSIYSIQEPLEARTKIIKIDGNEGLFVTHDKKRTIRFDLNPFIGCIGVAPIESRLSARLHGKDFGVNMVCPDIALASTLVFPCNVDGGLLSLGDVHGAQGDGEITGCALECRGEVTVRIRRLGREDAMYCNWPQINTEDYIGAIVCNGAMDLSEQIRIGYIELIDRMHRYYGFDKMDAYQLLNLVGKVRIGLVCNGSNSCVVKVLRKYLS